MMESSLSRRYMTYDLVNPSFLTPFRMVQHSSSLCRCLDSLPSQCGPLFVGHSKEFKFRRTWTDQSLVKSWQDHTLPSESPPHTSTAFFVVRIQSISNPDHGTGRRIRRVVDVVQFVVPRSELNVDPSSTFWKCGALIAELPHHLITPSPNPNPRLSTHIGPSHPLSHRRRHAHACLPGTRKSSSFIFGPHESQLQEAD